MRAWASEQLGPERHLLACADGGTTAPFESVGTVAPQPLREIGEIGVWPGRSSRVRGATQHPAHPSEEARPPELWRCREAGLASFDRLLHVAGTPRSRPLEPSSS